MGARRYTAAIDLWSVGCIIAELLGRRVLFQANSPLQQVVLLSYYLPPYPPLRHINGHFPTGLARSPQLSSPLIPAEHV